MKTLRIFLLVAVLAVACAAQAQVRLTGQALGTVKLNSNSKALPKTMSGLYSKLKYFCEENEMDDYTEEYYVGTLNGKETVKFEVGEGKKIARIEVYRGANVVVQTTSGNMALGSLTAKTLLGKGAKAMTNGYFYRGFFMQTGRFFFNFEDSALTPAGSKKVARNEGEESFKLATTDIKPAARPTSVSISIYK